MSTQCTRPQGSDIWRMEGWHVIQLVASLMLFIAATTKWYQYASEPLGSSGLLSARWLRVCLVEAECLGSFVLLFGALPARLLWALTLICFSAFACVSLAMGLNGNASCGCFGRWQVNPFLTALVDLAIVIALLRWRPRRAVVAQSASPMRALAVLAVWASVGLPAAVAVSRSIEATLSDAGEIVGSGRVILLKPHTWTGKRFPLLPHIDIGDRLATGLWLVLLHRHECGACREAAARYQSLAIELSTKPTHPSLALVECSRNAPEATASESLSRGHLANDREWHLAGPTSLLIEEGTVKSVFTDGREIALARAIWGDGGG